MNSAASNPPIPGVKGLFVIGNIIPASPVFASKGSLSFAINKAPIIPPSTAVPPNSFAAFIPTYIAR